MQQTASSTQQVLQVTASQTQIPVARYVSVVASKTEPLKTVGNIIKPIQTHQTKDTVRSAYIRGEPVQTVLNVKSRSPVICAGRTYSVFCKTTANQQQVHRQTSQQMYQNNTLQYVDSSGDHGYSNGSSANTFQYSEGNQQIFSNNQQQNNGVYFDSTSASAHVGSQATIGPSQHMNALGSSGGNNQVGQFISSPGGSTYLIQGSGTENGLMAMPISHATRASPATVSHFRREPKTVQWLMEHFESSEGVSLPRALMYNHYLLHCQEQQLDPVNAASYGKLVRSVFIGLRTRRLGTRGNSKYHYYGIRIKADSPLNRLHDEMNYIAMRQQPANHKRSKPVNLQNSDKSGRGSNPSSQAASATDQVQQQAQQHQQYLGDATQALPDLDPIQYTAEDEAMPDGITQEDLMTLEDLYRDHCANVLDIIVNLQFSMVESLWQTFWRSESTPEDQQATKGELEEKLSTAKLLSLCKWPPVQRWIKDSDHMMFQSLVEVLIPDVLRPIPSALTLAIRNFAKGLESGLRNALSKTDIPKQLAKIKVSAVSAFSQTLRRYTSLNHLAQAARAVLNDSSLITQMLADINRVDFGNVQEQAGWVSQCDTTIVRELETDFKTALSEQRTLEQWADWLETVVNKVLQPFEGTKSFSNSARQFLLKWCFYSSMVIRDLTLRSAASFGSFHLIRLLYDEYMFFLVEHRVAQATGETAIAVMGELASLNPDRYKQSIDSPASSASSESSKSSASRPAFIASALVSNATSKGIKRSHGEIEARVVSIVKVNGNFPPSSSSSAASKTRTTST